MNRVARCTCGDLSIKVQGEPKLSLACNCVNCQRRTGSVFGVSAYFDNNSIIEKTGCPSHFQGESDSGKKITTSFCSKCGSTVFWEADFFHGLVGIAVGCFSDPDFPEPSTAAWTDSKHKWVSFPEYWHCLKKQESKNA
ncbi:GFA family protein [Thalassotalea nanhaiensis]|uniref:GFA family protein n=1 Tax=Thalassotalea nanhaiensis TaxID=3065648 RepID=A0ABY9TM10_9GAMM|nr:GFA family protein [Colwelliaceae bacterium SQ345]